MCYFVFWPQLAESYPTRDWTCTPCVGSTVSTTGLRDRSFVLFFKYMKGQCEGNLVFPGRGQESREVGGELKYHITHSNKNGARLFVVQLPNCVQHFATPWTAARQAAPLSFTVFQSLLKFMSIELLMLSNHFILWRPLLLPSIFPSICLFQWVFTSSGKHIGASASVLPVNIQGWFPLGSTGLILLSKGLSNPD